MHHILITTEEVMGCDMMIQETTMTGGHKVQMNNRRSLLATGVKDVVSFDNKEVVLETVEGMLQLKGEEFHVKRLTLEKGEVDIEGKVNSMVYSDRQGGAKSAGSFVGRLFK